MCTVNPLTLETVRARIPGGIVELPYGGRLALPARTCDRATPCVAVNPPIAAAEAVTRNPRRDTLLIGSSGCGGADFLMDVRKFVPTRPRQTN